MVFLLFLSSCFYVYSSWALLVSWTTTISLDVLPELLSSPDQASEPVSTRKSWFRSFGCAIFLCMFCKGTISPGPPGSPRPSASQPWKLRTHSVPECSLKLLLSSEMFLFEHMLVIGSEWSWPSHSLVFYRIMRIGCWKEWKGFLFWNCVCVWVLDRPGLTKSLPLSFKKIFLTVIYVSILYNIYVTLLSVSVPRVVALVVVVTIIKVISICCGLMCHTQSWVLHI